VQVLDGTPSIENDNSVIIVAENEEDGKFIVR
jgi:hypothetical protein